VRRAIPLSRQAKPLEKDNLNGGSMETIKTLVPRVCVCVCVCVLRATLW
jgi:hypothetical protein